MTKPNARNITIGINVKSASSLPKVGAHLSAFLSAIEEYAGPADINLAVSVNPTPAAAIRPVESESEVVYVTESDEERD